MKLMRYKTESLVALFVVLAELVLTFRVIFKLFNAHESASFVHWIYSTSDVLLTPFRAVFSSTSGLQPAHMLDFVALFAMAVYSAAAMLLVGMITMPARKK